MGVTGLWRLLEPAGKPVPLETLENKVLAVDISIWLHQMVKGFQDARGGIVVNAHLLGLFQRLCKLLYYRIKPVFVFDGGVPVLKRQTIAKRQSKKSQMHNTVDRMRKQLLDIVTKQMAVNRVISEKSKSPKKRSPIKSVNIATVEDENLFKLPPMASVEDSETKSDDEESDYDEPVANKHTHIDLHSLDVNSEHFKSLTPREKHDLLIDLKETRKQSSWGRIHELPSQSDNFSDYQMKRLLKRRQFQVSLDETEKEMGGHYLSLNELEILLNEEGIDTKIQHIPTRRIASNENARFVLIKDVKEAIETATKKESQKYEQSESKIPDSSPSTSKDPDPSAIDELGNEFDSDLQMAIKLSLQTSDDVHDKKDAVKKVVPEIDLTFLGPDFIETDSEWSTEESDVETDNFGSTNLALAKAYMFENSGLSEYEIKRIINTRNPCRRKKKTNKRVLRNTSFVNKSIVGNSASEIKDEIITLSDNENETDISVTRDKNHTNVRSEIDLSSDEENSITKVITVSSNIKEKCILESDQMKSSVSTVQSEMSSDSDDSFEEVIEDSKTPKNKIGIEVTLKTGPVEDDIFADIFETDIKESSMAINSKQEESASIIDEKNEIKEEPVLDSSSDEFECVEKESIVIENKVTAPSKSEDISLDVKGSPEKNLKEKEISSEALRSELRTKEQDERVDLSEKDALRSELRTKEQEEHVDLSEKDAYSDQEQSTADVLELSPRKGMTLNEVRHLVCHEDRQISNEENEDNIENQMISTEELSNFASDLEVERDKLEKQQNKLDRMGRNISEEMTKDVQELLRIFGIPFIVAPMEAEAQCAFLEAINLTDGTITDDSDIWLFGGKSVYKNFFNQQKYVLQFLSENIQNCFKMTREQLILLALLVGSDYTPGVSGVGPVTAMEILSTFPSANIEINPPYVALLAGLKKFRGWWSNKRAFGHGNLRNKLKNISIAQDFPSYRVVDAYLSPQVDSSKEDFTWGRPDVTALRDYTKQKFGWSQNKTDEVLSPVLKRLDEKISQQSIRSFFRTEIKTTAAAEGMSKRVKKAVDRMGNGNVGSGDESQGPSKAKKPRKAREPTSKNNFKIVTETERIAKPNEDIPQKIDEPKPSSPLPKELSNQEETQSSLFTKSLTPNQVKKKAKCIVKQFIPDRYQETIPQREVDKLNMIKNKLKAIELFRTSKKGPGFIKKRKKELRKPKADAELSESGSD